MVCLHVGDVAHEGSIRQQEYGRWSANRCAHPQPLIGTPRKSAPKYANRRGRLIMRKCGYIDQTKTNEWEMAKSVAVGCSGPTDSRRGWLDRSIHRLSTKYRQFAASFRCQCITCKIILFIIVFFLYVTYHIRIPRQFNRALLLTVS